MADERTGLPTALEAALEAYGPAAPVGQPAQMDLLGSDAGGAAPLPARREGPGRPAGSPNKSTADVVKWINSTGEHPLMFLAKVYRQETGELAFQLSTTLEKAKLMQIAAAEKLLPYVAQKQPMAVQVSAAGEVTLVIATGPIGVAGEVVEGVSFEVEDEQNQQLGEG